MLSEKEPAEELDENNKKLPQKIIGKFLYFDRAIDSKILMVLNSLVLVHTKPTIDTEKQESRRLRESVRPQKKSLIRWEGVGVRAVLRGTG